jgi:2-oxo-4-hydroxy-4-carboxy-5-ureidoimidazoline decarboxylase
MHLETLNRISAQDFVRELGGIYEHSPWVAAEAAAMRPFAHSNALADAMRGIVDAADDSRKLDLIKAHPDLGGKFARAGSLTPESSREQAGLGLDRLDDAEFERFSDLNRRYRERFGFPFIICARLTTRDGVLAAFQARLGNDPSGEMAEALRQIHLIAGLRIGDKFSG